MDRWLVSFAIQWAAAKETLLIWVFKCFLERKIELIFASQEASVGGEFSETNECEQAETLSRIRKDLAGLALCESGNLSFVYLGVSRSGSSLHKNTKTHL